MSNVIKRMLVALILIPITIWVVIQPDYFMRFVIGIGMVMLLEYYPIVRILAKNNLSQFCMLLVVGAIVIIEMVLSMIMIRYGMAGLRWSIWLIGSVWATDIGAYIIGKRYGRNYIAPTISPKKSWEGLGGAMLASVLFSCGMCYVYVGSHYHYYFLLGLGITIIAQMGDFLESYVKRRSGVKDSGTLLPGHGGVWDRIDGFIFTAPIVLMMQWLMPQLWGG